MKRLNRLRNIYSILFQKISSYLTRIKQQADNQVTENKGIDITGLVATFSIILPIATFTYWRLLFEEFHGDYFELCFSFSDVYYLLYYKATLLLYISLLLLFVTLAITFSLHFWKYRLQFSIGIFICLTLGLYTYVSHFNELQCVLYMVSGLVIIFLYFILGKQSLYGFVALSALFLITSAQTDADQIKKMTIKKDIKLKNGAFFLKKEDNNKYYVTSTSKFVLIYDISVNKLIKMERDSIK
ncbi:hypothetical protein ACUN24_16000 [Pedobacter sp. WC2501]|uniref:hypothetical protein n=1 Tax=Pedobacter sp. WC2501 TaxID=3461400 RepID=UPI0040454E15